jgi:predicted DCC family thiol-disulfide oxidoreductase YuxK
MSGTQIDVFIDGAFPSRNRAMSRLRRLDHGRGRIAFIGSSSSGFDGARHGPDAAALMERIHGILPDGRVISGMEVFRRAYGAAGLGWLLAPTGRPILRPLFDAFYRWLARNRMRMTGRACTISMCR